MTLTTATNDTDWSDDAITTATQADYRELQAQYDQLQTELFNERKKSASRAVQIETLAKEVDAANDRAGAIADERDALADKNATLLECLCSIQQQCLMQIAMNYALDAEGIGQQIYEATGLTAPELIETVKS